MKQRTVKRAIEAWNWIHNNDHHIVGTEWHPTKIGKDGLPARSHLYLQNYHERLRVPEALVDEVWNQIEPNKRKFDSRMYALKRKAKSMVTS